MEKPVVTIIGGGMITHDQLLPSVYYLQREGLVGKINVSALNGRPLKELAASKTIRKAFRRHCREAKVTNKTLLAPPRPTPAKDKRPEREAARSRLIFFDVASGLMIECRPYVSHAQGPARGNLRAIIYKEVSA